MAGVRSVCFAPHGTAVAAPLYGPLVWTTFGASRDQVGRLGVGLLRRGARSIRRDADLGPVPIWAVAGFAGRRACLGLVVTGRLPLGTVDQVGPGGTRTGCPWPRDDAARHHGTWPWDGRGKHSPASRTSTFVTLASRCFGSGVVRGRSWSPCRRGAGCSSGVDDLQRRTERRGDAGDVGSVGRDDEIASGHGADDHRGVDHIG